MEFCNNLVGKETVWCRRLFLLSVLLIPFFLFSSPSWGQGKTVKMPVPKPGPQPSAKIPEKKEAPFFPTKDSPSATIDFELEMKKLETLIRLNDKNAEAYFNRARLYEYKGDSQKALQDYGKAIELNKAMKDAFYNRGLVFARLKKYEEAIKDFSEVIRIEPSAADAYCNRGNIYFQMGKMDPAIADYDAGLKVNPNDADLLYNRALAYLVKGEKGSATQDLRKSAQMFHDRTRRDFPELSPQPPSALKKAALEGKMAKGYMQKMMALPA